MSAEWPPNGDSIEGAWYRDRDTGEVFVFYDGRWRRERSVWRVLAFIAGALALVIVFCVAIKLLAT